MTIPLDRLRDFEQRVPPRGEVSLAVARHQASRWPSPEVDGYARERARLIHQLVDETGAEVISWGETDGDHPREVVEVILALGPALLAGLATVLAGWIARPKKPTVAPRAGSQDPAPELDATLPGIALRRSDGAVLRLTYRDQLPDREVQRIISEFVAGAIVE